MNIDNMFGLTALIIIIALGALRIILPRLFEKIVSFPFERRIQEIEHKQQTQLVELKGIIQSANKWDEIRLARLREEQTAVYKEIYSKLVTLYSKSKYVSYQVVEDFDTRMSKLQEYWHASEDFSSSYETQKIWIDPSLADSIEDFKNKLDKINLEVEAYIGREHKEIEVVTKAWTLMTGDVNVVKLAIELKFRQLMKVENV